jgi:hypothetical protein
MRSLNLITIIAHNGPTGVINAKILLIDLWPRIKAAKEQRIQSYTDVNMDIFAPAPITAVSRPTITAQATPELVYVRARLTA